MGAISNRKLFLTRNGYLGLGPNVMQIGDEVYVITGSEVPFVLRKTDRSSLDTQPEDENQIIPFPILDGAACQKGGEDTAVSLVLC